MMFPAHPLTLLPRGTHRWQRKLAALALALALLPVGSHAQRRDTLVLQGHPFLLAEMEEDQGDLSVRAVHLVRIQQPHAKWLLKHVVHSESQDCNSSAYEFGAYATTDSSITFYTLWLHTSQALADVCGVRKQTYAVTETGRVHAATALLWVKAGPMHPCLADLTTSQEDWWQGEPSREARTDRRLFVQCMEQELGGRFVLGSEREALIQEVQEALQRQVQVVEKETTGLFELMRCF